MASANMYVLDTARRGRGTATTGKNPNSSTSQVAGTRYELKVASSSADLIGGIGQGSTAEQMANLIKGTAEPGISSAYPAVIRETTKEISDKIGAGYCSVSEEKRNKNVQTGSCFTGRVLRL